MVRLRCALPRVPKIPDKGESCRLPSSMRTLLRKWSASAWKMGGIPKKCVWLRSPRPWMPTASKMRSMGEGRNARSGQAQGRCKEGEAGRTEMRIARRVFFQKIRFGLLYILRRCVILDVCRSKLIARWGRKAIGAFKPASCRSACFLMDSGDDVLAVFLCSTNVEDQGWTCVFGC